MTCILTLMTLTFMAMVVGSGTGMCVSFVRYL